MKNFAAFVLLYNIFVILWGAYVRATGSGAGCGEHWPLCNGEVLPRTETMATIIEFGHRFTSGLALIFVVILCVWAFKRSKAGDRVRFFAGFSLFFIIVEALIGAAIVLFGLVDQDRSVARAVTISFHLVNTLFLVASLVATYFWCERKESGKGKWVSRPIFLYFASGAGLFLILGASGAIAALGDTLFPASSLVEGVRQDFSSGQHFLVRLRVFHPFIAILTGAILLLGAFQVLRHHPGHRLSRVLVCLVVSQWAIGLINLILLAPVWIQMVHLGVANLIWIVFVLMACELFWGLRVSDESSKTESSRLTSVSVQQTAF